MIPWLRPDARMHSIYLLPLTNIDESLIIVLPSINLSRIHLNFAHAKGALCMANAKHLTGPTPPTIRDCRHRISRHISRQLGGNYGPFPKLSVGLFLSFGPPLPWHCGWARECIQYIYTYFLFILASVSCDNALHRGNRCICCGWFRLLAINRIPVPWSGRRGMLLLP